MRVFYSLLKLSNLACKAASSADKPPSACAILSAGAALGASVCLIPVGTSES